MRLLAIETATEACSTALWLDGEVLERHHVAPRKHAELLLADVDALLDEAGLELSRLDGLAFGRGPGSFTGVRIAAAFAQGLALSAGLPLAPVSTLAALAAGVMRERPRLDRVIAALDARMGEVYLGRYGRGESGSVETLVAESVVAPAEAPLPEAGGWFGAGHGFLAGAGALRARLADHVADLDAVALPRARDVAGLGARVLAEGGGVTPERAVPVYLREKVAEKPAR